MSATGGRVMHPDLEHYYDAATDRERADAHIAGCADCRARIADIDERLRDLPCNRFVELVTAYLEAALADRQRARVEDHLRLCEGCRNYLDEVRATLATIGRLRAASEPSEPARLALTAVFRAWTQSPAADAASTRENRRGT